MRRRLFRALPGSGVSDDVLYMRLNNSFVDQTGKHTPTASASSPTFVNGIWSGVANEAADFNGISQYITVSDSDDFSFTDGASDIPFTIFFSLNADDLGTIKDGLYVRWFFTKRNPSATQNEWQITTSNSATPKLQLTLFDQGTGRYLLGEGSTTLANSTDYFIAVTYDGTGASGSIKMYINGSAETMTHTFSSTYAYMTNGGADLVIATRGWSVNNSELDGRMDNIGIIKNKALSSAEIEAIRLDIIAGNEYL